ncbi:MAG: hypothetical protein QM803_09805 [Rhodocyclaceae bacterium]
MTIDMRRFSYRLQAVHTKAEWALDTQRVLLAAARKSMDACEEELKSANGKWDSTVLAMQAAQRSQLNPRGHAAALQFLLTLGKQIEQLIKILERRRQEFERLQASCATLHQRVEQLDAYRRDRLVEFVAAEQTRAQTASDAEWLQRAGWIAIRGTAQ